VRVVVGALAGPDLARPAPTPPDSGGLHCPPRGGVDGNETFGGDCRRAVSELGDFAEQRRRINERMIDTSYRVGAAKIAAANPNVDGQAAAAVLLGSVHNFRFNEVLIGPDANGVDPDRFIATWGAIYRDLLGDRPTRRQEA
jgi:hypothetical protein